MVNIMKILLTNKTKTLSFCFFFLLFLGIPLASLCTLGKLEANSEWQSNQTTFGTVKTASQTAYLNPINLAYYPFNTDGVAYGLDVSYSNVWIADGTNGIVKLSVNTITGVIQYVDGFDNGGTAYDVVYKNQWGNQMLVVADGEDGLEILDPEFDDLFPGYYPILSYGGGSIQNNTRSVAVYDEQLYNPGLFDPLTFIYTQELSPGSEVEAVYLFWDAIAILSGEFYQTASLTTDWANSILRVYVSGTYLYMAGWPGVDIYDISDPTSLSNHVAHCPDTQFSNDVFVQGNYLYVANGNELVIIDITTPATPVNVSSFDEFDGQVTKIFVDGNYAYLADSQGINIVDISNPASPEKIGSYAVTELYDIYVEGGFVYLAAGVEGFLLLELEVVEDTLSINSPSMVQTGKNYHLSWTSQGDIPNVKISLYSGGILSQIITPSTINTNSFDWFILGGTVSGTSYSIRIEDASNPAVMATTNTFEIYTNSLSFSSSYDSVTWETGKEYHISWESTGYITSVDIQLLKEGGVIHDIAIGTENDGALDSTLPADLEPSSEYQLKISDHNDPSISFTSEVFTIQQINEFWNELWFWGIIVVGLVLGLAVVLVVVPATIKKRRFKKDRRKFNEMNKNFMLTSDVNLFISYSHADDSRFKVPMIVKHLSKKPHVIQVVYSQKHTQKDFIKYMNEKIGESDGIILFCSKKSLKSKFVDMEWTSALADEKPVIPVFKDKKYIPPILKGKLGVVFMEKKLDYMGDAIYAVVKNHLGEPIQGKKPSPLSLTV